MHPLIKLSSFFVLAAFIVLGTYAQLALAAFMVLSFGVLGHFTNLNQAVSMIVRLRWLFLSILLVYVLLSPGILGWATQGMHAIAWVGVGQGMLRVFSLILIVIAVHLLVLSIPREQLVSAILSLLHPFRWLGLPNERLALRIALVLELTPQVRQLYQQCRDAQVDARAAEAMTFKQRLQQAGGLFVQTFSLALDMAYQAHGEEVSLPLADSPPWYQWLLPCVLLAAFLVLLLFDGI